MSKSDKEKSSKSHDSVIHKRWIRDFGSEQQTYVPAEKAKPSRRAPEGFELRPDGTYCEVSGGPTDATEEAEGTWELNDEGLLTLTPKAKRGKRRMRIIKAEKEQLVVDEESPA